MKMITLQPDGVRIPGSLSDLESFRRWVHSDGFPERGRIDWVAGEVDVDLSSEELNTHGLPKVAVAVGLYDLIDRADRGVAFIGRTRLSAPAGDLSVKPDVLVVLFESVESNRVRLIRRGRAAGGRCVEFEGAADLVVECVSDCSGQKDRRRLKDAYWQAGVSEYWIVDARVTPPALTVFRNTRRGYRAVSTEADGFIPSPVVAVAVRLVRLPARAGLVRHRLETRPL